MPKPKTEKQQARSREIILAALKAWQQTDYAELTMEAAAEQAGCSKPALYRYFPSKQSLLEEVQGFAVRRVHEYAQAWLEESRSLGSKEAVRQLVHTTSRLFDESPYILELIIVRHQRLQPEQRAGMHTRGMAVAARLEELTDQAAPGFLLFTAIFWNGYRSWFQCIQDAEQPEISEDWIVARCLSGFAGPRLYDDSGVPAADRLCHFARVEAAFDASAEEARREPHRFFSAVEQVVSEVGMANATVQKIAEKVGISASSLYFHFSSRSDLLEQAVIQVRAHFLRLFSERAAGFSGSPAEELYGFMVLLEDFYRHNPEVLTVGTWLRSHTIQPQQKPAPPDMRQELGFLAAGIDSGWFSSAVSQRSALTYLHMYIAHERMLGGSAPAPTARRRQRFLLALYGIGILNNRS